MANATAASAAASTMTKILNTCPSNFGKIFDRWAPYIEKNLDFLTQKFFKKGRAKKMKKKTLPTHHEVSFFSMVRS